MFREMRRTRQALPPEEISAVLERGTSGVLALAGDDGYPYAVPISYVYDGERIYFHSARAGHKLDAVRREPKASFCVIDQDQIVPAEYTTYFRSVIAFGTARELEDPWEKRQALEALAAKYSPEQEAGRKEEIRAQFANVAMVELTVEHMTGKEAIELVRQKNSSTL